MRIKCCIQRDISPSSPPKRTLRNAPNACREIPRPHTESIYGTEDFYDSVTRDIDHGGGDDTVCVDEAVESFFLLVTLGVRVGFFVFGGGICWGACRGGHGCVVCFGDGVGLGRREVDV